MIRHYSCVRCLCDGHAGVPATGMDGVNSVCVDHEANALRLCAACRYWVATVGMLCEGCAG